MKKRQREGIRQRSEQRQWRERRKVLGDKFLEDKHSESRFWFWSIFRTGTI